MFEGVPVMDTHDEPADLDVFLKAIYVHNYVHDCYEKDWNDYLITFGKLLKLAKKYDASAIRQAVVSIIEKEWPFEYWSWERIALQTGEVDRDTDRRWTRDSVMAMRLGLEYEIHTILPAAMYELCVLYELYDHTRTEAEAAAVDHWSQEAGDWPVHMARGPFYLGVLNADDFKRLWLGRGALRAHWIRLLQKELLVPSIEPRLINACDSDTAASCARAFDKKWKDFQESRNPAIDPDPLSCLQAIRASVQTMDGICFRCREHVLDSLLSPFALWFRLRRIFKLPPPPVDE